DILCTVVAGRVLRQQRFRAHSLLLGVLLLARGKPLLGQRQRGHADLVVTPIGGGQQVPPLDFFVLRAQSIVQIGDSPLVHFRVIGFYINLRERNAQQGRGRGEAHCLLVRLGLFADTAILEQHLSL